MQLEVIAFDGDDTLWHSETLFSLTQEKFRELVAGYLDGQRDVDAHLLAVERRNLDLFGYGVKGFILSMVETAIEVTAARISAADIQRILDCGKDMLAHPVELLDGVSSVLRELSGKYRLMLITKGDLFHQESKLARSGLAELFWRIEIVSEKDEPTYRRILQAHSIAPERFLMIGNSVKSDILPVLALGAHAVHVPYHITWVHEEAQPPVDGFYTVQRLEQLTSLLEEASAPR